MRPFKVRTNKYGAERVGHFDSKREAHYAAELELRRRATNGDVSDWIEQVSIRLPGGVRVIVDFLVLKRDGSCEFVEIKGAETQSWRNKMKQLAEKHPSFFKRLIVLE